MALKSLNKIYNDYVNKEDISFKDWLEYEKSVYSEKEKKSDFLKWMNIKYNRHREHYLNFDWGKIKDFAKENQDSIATVVGGLEEMARKNKNKETQAEIEKEEKSDVVIDDDKTQDRFLGLSPYITYGVGALLLFGVGFGIYKIVKRKNK